jgi:hypothetical protein
LLRLCIMRLQFAPKISSLYICILDRILQKSAHSSADANYEALVN